MTRPARGWDTEGAGRAAATLQRDLMVQGARAISHDHETNKRTLRLHMANQRNGDALEPNPYASPKRSCNARRPGSWICAWLGVAAGAFTLIAALVARWSGEHLHQDDFDVFLTLFCGCSCLVLPLALASVFLCLWLGWGWHSLLTILGVLLSVAGVVLFLQMWSW